MVQELTRQIGELDGTGLAILFAGQNLLLAAQAAERAHVIGGGRVRFAPRFSDLEPQPEINGKYLRVQSMSCKSNTVFADRRCSNQNVERDGARGEVTTP